ncbi:MAG: C2H2-type zinc finger protein [Nitrosopumilus sp.]|nr:C2H2-type zinc finger protein [Nitrosopumilus sp.]MDF2422838.1 C2H2-type zinc finger protein [Nitrosopumilus sp.]MDF2424437.1 C2H2-type zinc finger protein [Nitrosopumilus sp.]MDF2425109.1 C2H2-type zinc finger protein [Nitrosopumilus sp.]MDF2427292.1 C2H2-type zinc finger protein [Nitrosopumilus sp.]
MLTIDCRDVISVKNDLLVYVADQVAAIPTLKHNQFTLSSLDDDEIIDPVIVISAIKEFLDSINEGKNFAVISNHNMINITSISGTIIENTASQSEHEMFSCTHCGYVTQYEVELNVHMRIHYL